MPITRMYVDDSFIDVALQLDSFFLLPGKEDLAIDALRESVPSRKAANGEHVMVQLTPQQHRHFSPDFSIPTPRNTPLKTEHALTRFGILQLAIALSIGKPYGLSSQRDGVVVQGVFPIEEVIDLANTSFGALANFNFHNDGALHKDAATVPDFVLLSCVKNNEGATTLFVSLNDVLSSLDNETINVLMKQDIFAFGGGDAYEIVRVGPVLIETEYGFSIRIFSEMTASNAEAKAALEKLFETFHSLAEPVTLQSGDMLLSHNLTTPHARKPFEPDSNPDNRRYLQRIFIHTDA